MLGAIGKSILSLRFLGCEETESLCQADVVLKKALDRGRSYEFQLQVKDTDGDYTKVHSVITATTGTANFNPTFIPRIIHLDEVSRPREYFNTSNIAVPVCIIIDDVLINVYAL